MILVTGSNGLLGSFICRELKAEDMKFKALVREGSDISMLSGLEEYIIYGDFMDDEFLTDVIDDCTGIIHNAAVVSYSPKDKKLMNYINVEGTRRLVDLALERKVQRFLHVSSVAALGKEEGSDTVNEDAKWVSSKYDTNYGLSKHMSEMEVWRGIQENLNAVIINPSLILAPGNWDKSSAKIFRYVWDENAYYSTATANYVDVRDVSKIALALYLTDLRGERFVVSAGSVPYKVLFEKIAQRLRKRAPYKPVTKLKLRLVVILHKLREIITQKPAIITRETVIVAQNQITYNNDKIKNKLRFNFAPLDDTLDWCCEEIIKKTNQ